MVDRNQQVIAVRAMEQTKLHERSVIKVDAALNFVRFRFYGCRDIRRVAKI
ncbi:hypothetical protein YDYSG_24920 [Paenibacillus tyrfis]|nr:hypothetical protein YDYSG_24920 [Paenibacillus tyrfis]